MWSRVRDALVERDSCQPTGTGIAVGALGAVVAGGAVFYAIATGRSGWRLKAKTWITVKWPQLYELFTSFDPAKELEPKSYRAGFNAAMSNFKPPAAVAKAITKSDYRVICADGYEMWVRLYTPKKLQKASKPEEQLPVMYYIHGGGWVIGDLDTHDTLCTMAAYNGNFLVIAPHYRLAPEHKYPAAQNDCVDGLRWAYLNASQFGGDPNRLVVAGDSAGGHLALTTNLQNMKMTSPVPVAAQALVYPVTDYNFASESYKQYGCGYSLTTKAMQFFWSSYVDGVDADPTSDELLSPLQAKSFDGMPPTYILSCELDALKSEVLALAERMEADNVDVEKRHFPRSSHGFFAFPTIGAGGEALESMLTFFNKHVGGGS